MSHLANLTTRQRIQAWAIARDAYIKADGDFAQACAIAEREVEVKFDPATIALIIQLIVLFIKWWISRNEKTPTAKPTMRMLNLDRNNKAAMWGDPPQRSVSGAWGRGGYGGVGELDSRDFASVAANTFTAQPVILSASMAIETLAETAIPTAAPSSFFAASWIIQSGLFVALKVVSAMLRSHGESLIRNFLAWIWEAITDFISSVWPFGRAARRRRRDDRRDRRKGWFGGLFSRRRRRRER